ncbi:DUF1569 domain-containing protein [Flavobacterium sp.]|uniref:DUF1569 domain-containing protein n=1 Tax=Flavobacterium sp. TaxID=239 RepID=UPI00352807FB
MPSIYNISDNQAILNRINQLTPNSEGLWGKMTVDQMLKHCIAPLDITLGNTQPSKPNFIMGLLGKMLKNKIINGTEYKKNSPTAPDFVFTETYNFEQTKQELLEKVAEFQKGTQVVKLDKHPFFGKMSTEDWDKLQWKHLNHHLQQFGV